jgi:hypothetical protein
MPELLFREDRLAPGAEADDEYVEFWSAGAYARGEFRCVACGHLVVTFRTLPRCPVCEQGLWERDAWSPFTHMADSTSEAGRGARVTARPSLERVIPRAGSAGSGLVPARN